MFHMKHSDLLCLATTIFTPPPHIVVNTFFFQVQQKSSNHTPSLCSHVRSVCTYFIRPVLALFSRSLSTPYLHPRPRPRPVSPYSYPLPLPYSRLYLSTVLLPVSVLVSAPVSRKKCKFGCVLKNAPYPSSTSSSLSYSVVKAYRLSWLSFLSRVFSCVSLRVFSLYSVPFSHPRLRFDCTAISRSRHFS